MAWTRSWAGTTAKGTKPVKSSSSQGKGEQELQSLSGVHHGNWSSSGGAGLLWVNAACRDCSPPVLPQHLFKASSHAVSLGSKGHRAAQGTARSGGLSDSELCDRETMWLPAGRQGGIVHWMGCASNPLGDLQLGICGKRDTALLMLQSTSDLPSVVQGLFLLLSYTKRTKLTFFFFFPIKKLHIFTEFTE